jgi:hypothetical protein
MIHEYRSPGRRAIRDGLARISVFMPARFDARPEDAPPGTPPNFRPVGKGYTAEQIRIFTSTTRVTRRGSAAEPLPVVGVASREARDARRAERAQWCKDHGATIHPDVAAQRNHEIGNRRRRKIRAALARTGYAVLPAGVDVRLLPDGDVVVRQ